MIKLDERFQKQYDIYKQVLKQWGKTHNLSALLDDKSIEGNIYDSIEPFKILQNKIAPFNSFVDIGSGCGYPGIFVALHYPNAKAVLVEPRAKRAAFLSYVCIQMGLKNVEVKEQKIQDIKNTTFDLILSRAFIQIPEFLHLSKNLFSDNCNVLLYKGSSFKDEIKKANENKYFFEYDYKQSQVNNNRYFVLINKTHHKDDK